MILGACHCLAMYCFQLLLACYIQPCPPIGSTALTKTTIIFNLSIGSTNRAFLYVLFWPYWYALNSHMGQLPNESHWQQRWVFTSNNERVSLSQELNIRFHKSRKNFPLPLLKLSCLFTWFYPFSITNYICGQSFESINLFLLKRICILDKMALRSVNIGPGFRCHLPCAIDSLCLECAYWNQTPRKLFTRIYCFLFKHSAVRQGAKIGREERESQTVDSLISPTQSIKTNIVINISPKWSLTWENSTRYCSDGDHPISDVSPCHDEWWEALCPLATRWWWWQDFTMIRNSGNPMQSPRCTTKTIEKHLAVHPYHQLLWFSKLGLWDTFRNV